jgi:hypothetical protein
VLQAGRSPVRVPDAVDCLILPHPSSSTVALGSTQPLTEMGLKDGRRVGRTTLPPSVSRMSENVRAPTSRHHSLYRDNFTFMNCEDVYVRRNGM